MFAKLDRLARSITNLTTINGTSYCCSPARLRIEEGRVVGDVILFVFCNFWQRVVRLQDWKRLAEELQRLRLNHLTVVKAKRKLLAI